MDQTEPSLPSPNPYASRGGLKLHAALQAFDLDITNFICADLGCSVGGFTDCLLQHHANHVFAVDTAYGQLAWKLRQDPRVTTLERSNALHITPPPEAQNACELITLDLGWTLQSKALPATLAWLAPKAHIITLVKPHYESNQHRLTDEDAHAITQEVLDNLPSEEWQVLGHIPSPIRGAKGGNIEHLAWIKPA